MTEAVGLADVPLRADSPGGKRRGATERQGVTVVLRSL